MARIIYNTIKRNQGNFELVPRGFEYFNFRRMDSWNRWKMTLRDGSEVPENYELAYFIDELISKTYDCVPDERIFSITILSIDKKTSVCIDTCDPHPIIGPGQFKTGQQNVLEILSTQKFKMC